MSMQTTLTEDAPMILDATCSYGRVWPRHATIRIVTKAVKATNKKHHMISKRLEVTSEVFTESLDGDVDT